MYVQHCLCSALTLHTACSWVLSTDTLMLLMQEVPGRLWDGKEVILEAIGELITVEPHCVQPEEDVITALLGVAPACCASLMRTPFLPLPAQKPTSPCSSHLHRRSWHEA